MPGETTTSPPTFPPLTKQIIDNCTFSVWYEKYKKYVPKARVLKPLPPAFIEYLLSDGISIPESAFNLKYDIDRSEELSESEPEQSKGDEGDTDPASNLFPELHAQIESAIKELNGSVMPKLNWSAPKDAVWISTTNTLKCHSPYEIYLLLKSSSYVVHDLTEAYSHCIDYDPSSSATPENLELVLRQWVAINPALEFRCFVHNRNLVAVTQRDVNYFDFLEPLQDQLAGTIEQFFESVLQTSYPDDSFVFDVYIPSPYDRAWLIDINPYIETTDTLLLSWEEILNIDYQASDFEFELRLQTKENSSRSFGGTLHSENYVPKDIVDASLSGEGIANLARQWQSMMNLEDPGSESESDQN